MHKISLWKIQDLLAAHAHASRILFNAAKGTRGEANSILHRALIHIEEAYAMELWEAIARERIDVERRSRERCEAVARGE